MKSDQRATLIACVLALATMGVYFPVAGFTFITFDDPAYVTENPQILAGLTWKGVAWALTHAHASNWHPVTSLSHMLDCQVYGLNAGGHHATNLFFHIANTVLLFALLRRLTGALWRSAIVAALFALHPLHVESVAWVAERKDVLSVFFGLLCLHAYARYVGLRTQNQEASRTPPSDSALLRYYALTLLLFALALMSKPMLVTLPILMVLLDFWPLHRFTVFKESSQLSASEGIELGTSDCQPATIRILILEKLPFFALSAASCVITFLAQRAGGAVAALEQLPLAARTSNAVVSYVRYLVKLVWPADLAVIYPFQAWPVYLVWLAMLILAVVTLLAWRQRHHRPYLLVGWAWYLGALVPVIGIVQVGAQSIADRYTYLPSVGLFVALAWGVTDILRRSKLNTLIPAVVTASCLLVLSLVAQRQVACWQNTETLFRHAIAVTSNNSLAFNSLGRYFAKMHAWREAENSYRAALRIDPRFHNAWNNLGCALIDQGRCVEAITNCQKAIEFDSSFAEAHSNLGTALLNLGRTEQAISRYAEALRLRPDYEQAHYNLANALASQGRISEAREHFEAALKLNPLSASAHSNCGFMLAREGNFTRATTEFRSALALDPTLWQAHFGLGHALANLGQPAAAASEFAELLRFRPDDATARAQLELCQARMRSEGVQELRPGQAQ